MLNGLTCISSDLFTQRRLLPALKLHHYARPLGGLPGSRARHARIPAPYGFERRFSHRERGRAMLFYLSFKLFINHTASNFPCASRDAPGGESPARP